MSNLRTKVITVVIEKTGTIRTLL